MPSGQVLWATRSVAKRVFISGHFVQVVPAGLTQRLWQDDTQHLRSPSQSESDWQSTRQMDTSVVVEAAGQLPGFTSPLTGSVQTVPQPFLQHFFVPLHCKSDPHSETQIPTVPEDNKGHTPGFPVVGIHSAFPPVATHTYPAAQRARAQGLSISIGIQTAFPVRESFLQTDPDGQSVTMQGSYVAGLMQIGWPFSTLHLSPSGQVTTEQGLSTGAQKLPPPRVGIGFLTQVDPRGQQEKE